MVLLNLKSSGKTFANWKIVVFDSNDFRRYIRLKSWEATTRGVLQKKWFCKTKQIAKISGKHLCQSLFSDKVARLRLETLLKKRLWTGVFLWILQIFFFTKHLATFYRTSPDDCWVFLVLVYTGYHCVLKHTNPFQKC